jgi:hypothetical protein
MQRCQNNGNDVFYSFLCHPLDIFRSQPHGFSRLQAQSLTTSYESWLSSLTLSCFKIFRHFCLNLKEWSWKLLIIYLAVRFGLRLECFCTIEFTQLKYPISFCHYLSRFIYFFFEQILTNSLACSFQNLIQNRSLWSFFISYEYCILHFIFWEIKIFWRT